MFGQQDYKTKWKAVGYKVETPSGNLGEKSDEARREAFPRRFKTDGKIMPNPLSMSKVRVMNSDTDVVGEARKGPSTIGGVVGGRYDKDEYSGLRAGGRKRGG